VLKVGIQLVPSFSRSVHADRRWPGPLVARKLHIPFLAAEFRRIDASTLAEPTFEAYRLRPDELP